MTVEAESQIAAYARWIEDRAGVSMRPAARTEQSHPLVDAAVEDLTGVSVRLVPNRDVETRRGSRWLALAACVVVATAGLAVLTGRSNTEPPATSGQPSDAPTALGDDPASSRWRSTRPAKVTWYVPSGPSEPAPWDQFLVCRSADDQGNCAALAGTRAVVYRTTAGQIDVTTEYGPDESVTWQLLQTTGEEVDLGDRTALTLPGNDELVGFQASPDVRVIVRGEAGTDLDAAVAGLTTSTESLDLPTIFGEAVATPEEMTRDGGGAVYYAAYLDISNDPPCVASIAMPWNNGPFSCTPTDPDMLTVTVASPSPTGTILIATLPLGTARAVVTVDGGLDIDLAITDASQDGFKLTFADLDAAVPVDLIAYNVDGAEIGRTPISSTGGAPLGYLPSDTAG